MPHPDLWQDFPKLIPKKVAPNLFIESPQGNTSPPMWSNLDSWASLPLFVQVCLRITEMIFLSLLFKYVFLGCAPLFSYMDSKGHHHESSHPLVFSCLFMNHHNQKNRHAPSQTQCTQMNPCSHQPLHPLGLTHHNLFGAPLLLVISAPCFASYFGKPLARSCAQGTHFPN